MTFFDYLQRAFHGGLLLPQLGFIFLPLTTIVYAWELNDRMPMALLDRLTSVYSSASATNFTTYDPFGDVTSSQQVTGGQTYIFSSYTYNLLGEITSLTYPSSRQVTTGYDSAGRAISSGNIQWPLERKREPPPVRSGGAQ